MRETRRTIFISDLHLDESRPQIAQLFLTWLHTTDSCVDALYILGDLFEAWIGDDDNTLFHREIIHAIAKASQNGLPIYFVHGNRDFLIGKKFLCESGCKLLPDETEIQLYNMTVLIMHGDMLCTKDTSYLRARKLLRNCFLQKLFLFLPLSIRRKIANKLRKKSFKHTANTPMETMDVTQEEVETIMKKHHVQCLIHGHTHRPGFHHFSLNNLPASRVVLDAWHEHGNMLVWDEFGKKELIEF
ncbi:MAG: UDP-2,3-diacylglucosamine diphosphatase [Gammaproteobacteria bacterium]|nr:UDP-2,3-diacylglucosamine diphosphatase [Gammaproteobacteria bacterium]MCW5583240.1 UDP-2,3-diacylglucosamine diphosphatase [Gammaproteobacteria bacterium]